MKATMYVEINRQRPVRTNLYTLVQRLYNSRPAKRLATFLTTLLEEPVSPRQSLKLLHAEVAFLSLLLFGGMSISVCAILLAWTLLALWDCRRAFISNIARK